MVKTNAKRNYQLRYTISVVLSSCNSKITVFEPNFRVQKRFYTSMGNISATRGRPDENLSKNWKKKNFVRPRIRTHELPPIKYVDTWIHVKSDWKNSFCPCNFFTLRMPNLISRKIRVIEKWLDFHTVCIKEVQLDWYILFQCFQLIQTSNWLEHVHLLVIEPERPNFGFELTDIEHRTQFTQLLLS